MKRRVSIAAFGFILVCNPPGFAADLPETYIEPPAPLVEESGIWGAIAYSQTDGEHGFFWGADKRIEAEENAVTHCENAGGETCAVVTVFRNHRHWDDDDGSGFPYNHCGVLAVGSQSSGATPWAAASATTRKDAEEQALRQCEANAGSCEIREWVCT